MAKPELGVKRRCTACGAAYFDLNKDPIVCPKCGTAFVIEPPKPSRKKREPEPPKPVKKKEEPESEEAIGDDEDGFLADDADEDEEDVADVVPGEEEET